MFFIHILKELKKDLIKTKIFRLRNIYKQNNIIVNMNKHGDTNWVLIMLILGIIVLVVLAGGFILGWSKFFPWLSTDNIEQTVTQCNVACTTNAKYGFCIQNRTINDGTKDIVKDVTCNYLATEYSSLGFENCPQISCD